MSGEAAADFAALLRQLREQAGLTQAGLAEAAGLGERTVSDLERGRHLRSRKDTAEWLADGLELTGEERARFIRAARRRPPPGQPPATGAGGADGPHRRDRAGVIQCPGHRPRAAIDTSAAAC